jgi:isochorismate synthase
VRSVPDRVRVERLGPAFDLAAGYAPGGCFMERSGLGVAGTPFPGTRAWALDLNGPRTTEELFAGLDQRGLDPQAPAPLVFGTFPFEPERSGRFMFPARTIRRDREGQTWAIELIREGAEPMQVRSSPSGGEPGEPFSALQVFPEPEPGRYESAVASAVARIREGSLRKVVLARTLRVEAGRRLDPGLLLRRLRAVEPDCYTFAVDVGDDRTLVGASPELLVSRFGREVRANPLAGSAPRAGDPDDDRANARELGSSAKNRQEHSIVVEAVFRALQPLCEDLRYDVDPTLLATANVWHLSTRFRGTLKDPSTTSLDLVAALHPTPAVCGDPTRDAMQLVRELEPVARGHYAGAVGWMDANGDGVWALALRCAELHGETARLFAGAGIVADSEPARELDETERKFRAFLDSLRWG